MSNILQELVWPRPEEVLAIAKERILTSEELLALMSSSFFGPIRLSGLAKGKREHNKEPYFRTGYNALRGLDQLEDASSKVLSVEQKVWAINGLAYVIGEVVRMNGDTKRLEDLINGADFRSVTQMLMDGSVYPDGTVNEKSRVFGEHFGKGVVLKELQSYDKPVREAIDYCVKSMAGGMTRFLERGPIQTEEQLRDYCFHVAGRIGSGLLNKSVELKDRNDKGEPIKLNDDLAEETGEYLQVVNISKNVRTDLTEGRKFIPQSYLPNGISFEYMMDGKGLDAVEARKNAMEKIWGLAESKFNSAIEYGLRIPPHLSGYKAFFMVPIIVAKKTLENERAAGAEAVVRGDKDAIKISYGIDSIMKFSYDLAVRDGGIHANPWLEKFRKNPGEYPFDLKNYESWAPSVFTGAAA